MAAKQDHPFNFHPQQVIAKETPSPAPRVKLAEVRKSSEGKPLQNEYQDLKKKLQLSRIRSTNNLELFFGVKSQNDLQERLKSPFRTRDQEIESLAGSKSPLTAKNSAPAPFQQSII